MNSRVEFVPPSTWRGAGKCPTLLLSSFCISFLKCLVLPYPQQPFEDY